MKHVKHENIITLLLLLSLPLVFLASLSLGSLSIPFSEIVVALLGKSNEEIVKQIVLDIRLPKALTAMLAGIGLGLSGLQMQSLFRNPLAGPFVLGISSGAGLGVALLVLSAGTLAVLFPGLNIISHSSKVIAASLGSGLVLALIMLINIRIKDSMVLLIAGLMFGTFASAIISILQYFSQAEQIQNYLMWTFGSLGSLDGQQLIILTAFIMIGIFLAVANLKGMNAMILGENYAQSIGIKTQKTAWLAIISTALMAGAVTAFCGPLAFIGISVPHMARLIIPTANQFKLFPLTILIGAHLMLICDMIAQVPGSSISLPINAVTSLFGAPIVIWLIIRARQVTQRF